MNCIMNNMWGKTRKALVPKELQEIVLPAPQAEIQVDVVSNIYPVQQLAKARLELLEDIQSNERHPWKVLKAKLGISPGGQITKHAGDDIANVWIPDPVPHHQWSAPVCLMTALELKALGVSCGEATADPASVRQTEDSAQSLTGSDTVQQHKVSRSLSILPKGNPPPDKETSALDGPGSEIGQRTKMGPAREDKDAAAVSNRKRKLDSTTYSDVYVPIPKTASIVRSAAVTDCDVDDIPNNSLDANTQSTDTENTVTSTSNTHVNREGSCTSVTIPNVINLADNSDNSSDDSTQSVFLLLENVKRKEACTPVTTPDVIDLVDSSDDDTQKAFKENVKGKDGCTSVTTPDFIDLLGSSDDNSGDNTQSTNTENTLTSSFRSKSHADKEVICTSVSVTPPDVTYLLDSSSSSSDNSTQITCTENTSTCTLASPVNRKGSCTSVTTPDVIDSHSNSCNNMDFSVECDINTITDNTCVRREGTGKPVADSDVTGSVTSSRESSDGGRQSNNAERNTATGNSQLNREAISTSVTTPVVNFADSSNDSSDTTQGTHNKAKNIITSANIDISVTNRRDTCSEKPDPSTDNSSASAISRAVSGLLNCLNEPSAGISRSVVWQTGGDSSGPLCKTRRMFSKAMLAEEHARYVQMEQEGQVHNAEPVKVAALDMWERKTLREMGLVDCQSVTVAHDADGNEICLNESLEVINGLVFFKLAFLLPDIQHGEDSPPKLTLPALMDGLLGGVGYKCDYCTFCTDKDIVPHLMKAQHPSGSSVLNFREKGQEEKARCILVPGLIKVPAPFTKSVPVCPVCHAVFEDIMDCVSHTYTHGGITGAYQLRPVSRIKTITITKVIKCWVCKAELSSVKALLEHWKQTKHVELEGEEHVIVFYCCQNSEDCGFRSSDFEQMCRHILSQHLQDEQRGEAKGIVKGVYLGGPTPVRHLMPFFPMSCVDIVSAAAPACDAKVSIHESNGSASQENRSVSTDSSFVTGRPTVTGNTEIIASSEGSCAQQTGGIIPLLTEDSSVYKVADTSANTVQTNTPKDPVPHQIKPSAADISATCGESEDTAISVEVSSSADGINYEQLAAEHEHYLSMERQGLICNVEPRMVAGLDMLERKTLRDNGLVDLVRPAVARDVDGKPICLDNSLELINGLVFLKLSAVLEDKDEKDTRTQIRTETLMKGSFGGIAYKCDYCKEVCLTADDLLSHLKVTQHPTGSTVLKHRGQPCKPRCIIVSSSVKHPPSIFQSLVAVCPVCHAVFEEIMDCVAHTHTHGGITGVYQLRLVLRQEVINVTKDIKCCVCKAEFTGLKVLLEHWRDTKHVQLESEKPTLVFFLCHCSSDCHYRSSEPEHVLQHVLSEHLKGEQCFQGVIKGVCLEGPTPIKQLMPFFPVHCLDNGKFHWELRHLGFHNSCVDGRSESNAVITTTLSTSALPLNKPSRASRNATSRQVNKPGASSGVIPMMSVSFDAGIGLEVLQSNKPYGTNISSVIPQVNRFGANISSMIPHVNRPFGANFGSMIPQLNRSFGANISSVVLQPNRPCGANTRSTVSEWNGPSGGNSRTTAQANKASGTNTSSADHQLNKPSVANSSTVLQLNRPSVAISSTVPQIDKPSVASSPTFPQLGKPSVGGSLTVPLLDKPPVASSVTVSQSEKLPRVNIGSTASPLSKPYGATISSMLSHFKKSPSLNNSTTFDQPGNSSFSPLNAVSGTSAELLAKEHEHYVSMEQCCKIRNAEPRMVAALNMWERKALRSLGLVDQVAPIVACDDGGKPIALDDSLELHRGLAFIKLAALLRGSGSNPAVVTQVSTRALMSGSMFGGIAYRCDYCAELFLSEDCLLSHLKKGKHASGSVVLRRPRKKRAARCIIVPSSVKYPPSFFQSRVPVCPVCHAAFREIMDCVAHTYTHGGITGVYQLSPVCESKIFLVTEDFRCTRCRAVFSSITNLLAHWKQTEHVQLAVQKYKIATFCCGGSDDCYFHSDSFEQAYLHALIQHLQGSQRKDGKRCWIKGLYLSEVALIRRLMPFFPVHCLDVDPSLLSHFINSQSSQGCSGKSTTAAGAECGQRRNKRR